MSTTISQAPLCILPSTYSWDGINYSSFELIPAGTMFTVCDNCGSTDCLTEAVYQNDEGYLGIYTPEHVSVLCGNCRAEELL